MKREQIDKEIKELKRKLIRYRYIIRGTIITRYQRCGKSNCKCQRDVKKRHGPYYYYTRKEKGKTVGRVYNRKEAMIILQYLKDYNEAIRIIRRISRLSEYIILRG